SASIILDTTPPNLNPIQFYCPSNANVATTLCNGSVVTLGVSAASIDAVQVLVSNDAGFANPSAFALTAGNANVIWVLTPGDGNRTLYASVVDAAGNKSIPLPY